MAKKKATSYFFYIHPELAGVEGIWKSGKGMTPYSVVRLRARFVWKQFALEYIWFGRPSHIDALEYLINDHFSYCSGAKLNNHGAQEELFKIDKDTLIATVEHYISQKELDVKRLELAEPYTATNSKKCPYSIPTEVDSHHFLNNWVTREFGEEQKDTIFDDLFPEGDNEDE